MEYSINKKISLEQLKNIFIYYESFIVSIEDEQLIIESISNTSFENIDLFKINKDISSINVCHIIIYDSNNSTIIDATYEMKIQFKILIILGWLILLFSLLSDILLGDTVIMIFFLVITLILSLNYFYSPIIFQRKIEKIINQI